MEDEHQRLGPVALRSTLAADEQAAYQEVACMELAGYLCWRRAMAKAAKLSLELWDGDARRRRAFQALDPDDPLSTRPYACMHSDVFEKAVRHTCF